MNLLGSLFADVPEDIATPSQVPYEQPYTPPYTAMEPEPSTPPYEESGIVPLQRPSPPPLPPLTPTRYMIPNMPGPRYIQREVGKIIPARYAPYPEQRMISDRALIKILVSKNTYFALESRGLPTMAMRRRQVDSNTRREIESDVLKRTLSDVDAIQRGEYGTIESNEAWQYEAIQYNLVDAAELLNIMARIVGIQVWKLKERG